MEPRPVSSLNGDFEFPALPEGHYRLLVYWNDAPESSPYSIPFEAGEGASGTHRESRQVVRVPPWVPVVARVFTVRPDRTTVENPAGPAAGALADAGPRQSMTWLEPAPVQVWLTPVEGKSAPRGELTMNLRSSEAAGRNEMHFPQMILAPGTYRFEYQAPERWYVASVRNGDVDLMERGIFVLAEHPYATMPVFISVEIRQGGAALEGLVVNANGEPLSGGAMCALAEEPARRAQPGGAFCVRADGDGAFRSHWLSPGEWRVWALTRRPHESPSSPAFQEKYERQARKLTVPESGAIGMRTLVGVE
jgi:hypothetical protein